MTSKEKSDGLKSDDSFRGIPASEFIDDIEHYMKKSENDGAVEVVLRRLEEMHQKYKIIENSLFARRERFKQKLPDLRHSLELLEALDEKRKKGETTRSRFTLSDQCYATAVIPPTDKVSLWLGANVMLEYSVEEGRDLLQRNITSAEKGIKELTEQSEFIKDQLTTTEVNIARVYNWGVQQRKAQAAKQPIAS